MPSPALPARLLAHEAGGRAAELFCPARAGSLGTYAAQPDERDGLLRRFADLVFVRSSDKLKLYWVYEHSDPRLCRNGFESGV